MNLHEYQAKELLKKYNVTVQEGFACSTVQEAEEAYRQIHTQTGSKFAVIKAQIHATSSTSEMVVYRCETCKRG